jgi:CRISPR-associated protein Csb2
VASAWAKGQEPRKQASELKTLKTVQPQLIQGDKTVRFLWKLPKFDEPETAGICNRLSVIARSIVVLGCGIDLVAGDARIIDGHEASKLPGKRWIPVASGNYRLIRVPMKGTLGALQTRHQAFLSRLSAAGLDSVPALTVFRASHYHCQANPQSRPCAAFKLLEPSSGKLRSYAMTNAVRVAGMLRHAVAETARGLGRPEDWINQYVLGHPATNQEAMTRFSYLPLPSVDPRRNVVSGIRRVIVAERYDGSGHFAEWAERALQGQVLINEKNQQHEAVLETVNGDGVLDQYLKPSSTWATVTPVALPGSDDGKSKKRERLFFKALAHASHSPVDVVDFECRRVPYFRGAADPLKYRPRPPHYLGGCSVYHVLIRWRHPVQGPIAIGSGRHCGLGVFAIWHA